MKIKLRTQWLLPLFLLVVWIGTNSCKEAESGKMSVSKLQVGSCSHTLKSDSSYPEEEFRFEKINDYSYRFVHKNLLLACDVDACKIEIAEDKDGFIIYESSEPGMADCLCPKDISYVINSTEKISGCTITVYHNKFFCYTGIITKGECVLCCGTIMFALHNI
ncbi:MAG: hypothetical protein J6K31_03870 [Parabacteroides sp.]|nr:hypothetical protein [Parabacteroides sp.]